MESECKVPVCVCMSSCVFYHTAIWLCVIEDQGRPSPLTRLYLTTVLLLLCARLCACYSCSKCVCVSVCMSVCVHACMLEKRA